MHGTFSNTARLLEGMQQKTGGQAFLKTALKEYGQVLAFNHRTLATTPMINARGLFKAFRSSKAEVHVICHSRGSTSVSSATCNRRADPARAVTV